jgi:SAM-dependent methyltransferase
VLSLGGAFAAEFEKVARNIKSVTVIEPARKFWRKEAYGLHLNYLMPHVDGHLDFPDQTFDTITAFGVLHHIPNVSFVLSELARVLKPGGNILLREPIISMGDWSVHRPGLTKNERGIPHSLLGTWAEKNNLKLVSQSFIGFSPLQKICTVLRRDFWSSRLLREFDFLLCAMFRKNYKYHRVTAIDRFAPSTVFLVLQKGQ